MQKNSVLLAFAAALFIFSCSKDGGKLIARAGQVKITKQDLLAEIENSPDAYKNFLSTLEGKKQFLDILLREKILLNAAEKSGVVRRKEIQQSLKDYRERMKGQEVEFRKGLVLREYLRDLKDKDLKVEERDIKKYYEEHRADFANPVKVSASHILTATEADARAALARVKKGEDFAKVARETSADPSAERGGMIGEVSKGDLSDIPEFETELWKLKSGQISGIVKTRIGFHIIRKSGEIRLPEQTFEQAAVQIHRVLEKKKFDDWVEKSKKEQKVWIDENALAAVPVQRAEPRPGAPSLPPAASPSSGNQE